MSYKALRKMGAFLFLRRPKSFPPQKKTHLNLKLR